MSLLPFIEQVDGFSYDANDMYKLMSHDGKTALGYLTSYIAKFFEKELGITVNHDSNTVKIDANYDTLSKRDELFRGIAEKWKLMDVFELDLKHGWRDELYTVYSPTSTPYMHIERAFSVLIGVITYGVHINGYVSDGETLKMWIPRRSPTKPTYPGMLDNMVAGGLGYPYGIWETVVKECLEEAGLNQQFVESHTKSTGVMLYMYRPDNQTIDRVQPEVEYIFDIKFPDELVKPYPVDGEAEDFQLMEIKEVLQRLRNGEFKPNCGLVVVDFLIRHGVITPANEPNYLEIVSRCHRRLPFPTL